MVIAKQPVAGRVKTRLTPPLEPIQAAGLAAASLQDTLDVVASTPAARRVLVFEGDPAGIVPDGFDVVVQRGDGLGERLQAAFDAVGGPALLIGMDTPQVTSLALGAAAEALLEPGVDAVIGATDDGGYWCVGFKAAVPGAFEGVPMSAEDTFVMQLRRFESLGLRVRHLGPRLRDVDTFADARAVAAVAPETRFARALAAIG